MTRFVAATGEGTAPNAQDTVLASAHHWAGILILVLLVARFGLRFIYGVPVHSPTTPRLMALAGNVTHWAFFGLLVAVPVSGLPTYYGVLDLGDIHGLARPVFHCPDWHPRCSGGVPPGRDERRNAGTHDAKFEKVASAGSAITSLQSLLILLRRLSQRLSKQY